VFISAGTELAGQAEQLAALYNLLLFARLQGGLGFLSGGSRAAGSAGGSAATFCPRLRP